MRTLAGETKGEPAARALEHGLAGRFMRADERNTGQGEAGGAAEGALRAVLEDGVIGEVVRAVGEGVKRVAVVGSWGSSASITAYALARATGRIVLHVVAHLDEADDTADELNSLFGEGSAVKFPAMESLPGETHASVELFAERARVVRASRRGEIREGTVVVAPIQALMQGVPGEGEISKKVLHLARGERKGLDEVVRWLDTAGYERVEAVEEAGQYAVRGGILDVFACGASSAGATGSLPVRLDFFGDEVESISEFDLESMGSGKRLDGVEVVGAEVEDVVKEGEGFWECLSGEALVTTHELMEVVEQGRGYFERVVDARGIYGPPAVLKGLQDRFAAFVEVNQFSQGAAVQRVLEAPVGGLMEFAKGAAEAVAEVCALARCGKVVVFCEREGEAQRFEELMAEFGGEDATRVERRVGYLHRGFVWGGDDEGKGSIALVPYHEIVHRYETRRRVRRLRGGRATDAFFDLQEGDYVVHAEHGIARFAGLKTMRPRAVKKAGETDAEEEARRKEGGVEEYLTLEFAGRARLHVPATQIEQVQRYVGGFKGKPKLSTLGGKRWKQQKEQTGEAVKDLAGEMLRVQAARAAMPGVRYPGDTAWQKEFEAAFPFEETEDQLASLAEIKKDMTSTRPMDRLLCGDVGFGKTELAIRAAFKCAEFGKQVAVLAPTTVLVVQHERTFRSRLAGFPFRVESVSRFKSAKEQNEVLAATRKGQVDILIGTHRLLSKDVKFADLGLVVIDEEQRFGVEHKQALLSLRMTVDVLTLSATPIPRTLHMAMLGIRDISSLTTAPVDRRAIVTEVIPYNEKRMANAIARELAREGQVFVVHNRVHSIEKVADEVRRLAPGARVIVGHGQMEPRELEEVMLKFVRREADVLVSTTIIESGIDIPTANTMIITDADRYGLADLHQLRGRVGRYKHRAYCYLFLPGDRVVSETARKRLRAIEEFSMLGAGFKIAMRDLEIRGAGNLLGAEQSGHIAAVGYDMYCRLLERAVRELRNERVEDASETTVEIGVTGSIPKAYIPSDSRRMEAYRRIARARTREELRKVEKDLQEAYGEAPQQARRLLDIAEVRIGAHGVGVSSIVVHEKDVIFRCEDAGALEEVMKGARGTLRVVTAPPGGLGSAKGAVGGKGKAGAAVQLEAEVYYRPPEAYLEGGTLLAMLRKRFGEGAAGEEIAKSSGKVIRG